MPPAKSELERNLPSVANPLVRKFIQTELLPLLERNWDTPKVVDLLLLRIRLKQFADANQLTETIKLIDLSTELGKILVVPRDVPKEMKLSTLIRAELLIHRLMRQQRR